MRWAEVVPELQKVTNFPQSASGLSEDEIKKIISEDLNRKGWKSKVAWGHQTGLDIEATKDALRWVVEVKGSGSRPQMRVNYFLAILGEILQRMDDPDAKYSIALPDMPQYRRLWERLPKLAKGKLHLSILFVSSDSSIEELN